MIHLMRYYLTPGFFVFELGLDYRHEALQIELLTTFRGVERRGEYGLQGLIKEVGCVFDYLVHIVDVAYQLFEDDIEHSDDSVV